MSTSYLGLSVRSARVKGQWEVSLRDLEAAVGLDADGDGAITWRELRSARRRIADYALGRLKVGLAGHPVPLRLDALQVDDLSDGAYAVLRFSGKTSAQTEERPPVSVDYNLLFDLNPQHRGLLSLKFTRDASLRPSTGYETGRSAAEAMLSGEKVSAIFGPDHRRQLFTPELPARWKQARQFFTNGLWHIWSGYDHIAFLLALLLPAVFIFSDGRWSPAGTFPAVAANVLKIVSAFSLAHSLTFTAAALGLVHLPSRLVESAIAASIVWGAVSNFVPRPVSRAWQIAFAFGLMHGFGFASVLQDLDLTRWTLLRALVCFNLGVEAGQLAIVAVVLPPIFALRSTTFYRKTMFACASALIGLFGFIWLIERVFNVMIVSRFFTA